MATLSKSVDNDVFESFKVKDFSNARAISNDSKSRIDVKSKNCGKWEEIIPAKKVLDYLQKKGCKIRNEAEVMNFLVNRPNVISILKEAPDIVEKYFKEADLHLELFRGYEKESHKELLLNIVTTDGVEKASEKLDILDDEWFLPIAEEKNIISFNIDLGFK